MWARSVGACLAAAALLVGCARTEAAPELPSATAACDAAELQQVQSGLHLVGDTQPPVPYSSTPPSSGWHTSGTVDIAVQAAGDALTEPQQVTVLEAGGVVVTYGRLPAAAADDLGAHVAQRWPGAVAVSPYDELAAREVVFARWGVLQRCDGVDLAALDAFADAYTDDPAFH